MQTHKYKSMEVGSDIKLGHKAVRVLRGHPEVAAQAIWAIIASDWPVRDAFLEEEDQHKALGMLLLAIQRYRKRKGLPLTAPFLDMFREYYGPEQVTAKASLMGSLARWIVTCGGAKPHGDSELSQPLLPK